MSMSNSFSKAMTSSTVSRLSAPRSSMKLASDVSLSRSTPSSSTMISLTFSSSCFISIAMGVLNRGVGNGSQHHRSEEHTSELQSQSNLVCRLLLEKKQQTNQCDETH